MFDIKGRGHFARRWLREVTRIQNRGETGPHSYWCLRAEDIFFFSWFDDFGAADIPDIVDKRRPLFLDTHNFAMLHRAFN